MTATKSFEIRLVTQKRADGFYEAVAYCEPLENSLAIYHTGPDTSYTRRRAISYALTELAVMFDRGAVKEAEDL